jgi:signal transduction histidine kinase
MVQSSRVASNRPGALLDAVLIAVVAVLVAGTALSVIAPQGQMRFVSSSLDLVLDTLTSVVTLGVAALGWVRFRQLGDPMALLQAAAFLVLAVVNTLTLVLMTSGLDLLAGLALAHPGQAPLYVQTFARLLAAALLVLGGVASLRSWRAEKPLAVVSGTVGAMLVIVVLVEMEADRLPSLGSVPGLAGPAVVQALPMPTPLGAAIQVLAAGLFLWAAGLSRRLYRRDGSIADAYLSVGLVFAAFAQVQAAMNPGVYAGVVTSGALLRLIFDVLLLLGIQAEASATLARLRGANEDLARLRAVEAERAALEERTRLSRELHDGLAQDLWLAKLKAARLAAQPGLGPEASVLAGELGAAIDAGLAEAQQAVAAIRLAGEPAGTLGEVMTRTVDEFADRFGLRVELECDPDLPLLSPRAQAETLRIVQEALSNVRRHADATVVRVRVGMDEGRLCLVVGDNGRGFDPATVGPGAFGLASMRERADLIGGELHIDSRPRDGTRVSLLVPVVSLVAPAAGSP